MGTRPDKPREYFSKLLDVRDEEIDYSEVPPTTANDWKDAEVLLPVTPEEFRAIRELVRVQRSKSLPTFQKLSNFSEDPLRPPLGDTMFPPQDISGKGPTMAVIEQVREGELRFELAELLHQVHEAGYAQVHLRKLLRLLGKGSRAAGTWRKLVEAWEELGYEADELYCIELPGERILLIWRKPDRVRDWSISKN
ncbi:MAG TPA: hypothetical protein VM755_20785 [Stellaceae bacterium]|nr:hypothetical protein [Stellaceae bacterium]